MAEVFVPVMSVKQYFRRYAVEGIAKGAKPELVKQQLLDAFQKEIFGQLTMKYHDAYILSRDTNAVLPEVREGINSILMNSVRKWKRLCMMFAEYPETRMIIEEKDLMDLIRQIINDQQSEPVDDANAVVSA